MPGAGYENRCRTEKPPLPAGGTDSGNPLGLNAAADGYSDSNANAGSPGSGNPGRAAGFNAAANPGVDPNASPGKASGNAVGNRQRR